RFKARHGVDLGLMSLFARAVIHALREVAILNARIDGTDIVKPRHVHLGIAVSTSRGLVVPVVRGADGLSLAALEQAIGDVARRAREGKLAPGDLAGGTFTITNGGVFGSLLSTPILNPPQSGILGMHKIEERPVARQGQVVIRPMLYVALSLDLAGHGESPPLPPHPDLAVIARDVLETVRALEATAPWTLIGHSLGGRVTLRAALLEPAAVAHLTLLDVTPSPRVPGGEVA